MRGLVVRQERSTCYRVSDVDWDDPLDDSFSLAEGGRWNPPGEFGMVYLCADENTARAYVAQRLRGQPYGPEDLDEGEAPDLAVIEVPNGSYRDCFSERGLIAVGLSPTYPAAADGSLVGWEVCQPIGRDAYLDGLDGVTARSASFTAGASDRELAHIRREERDQIALHERVPFSDWFWGES